MAVNSNPLATLTSDKAAKTADALKNDSKGG